MVTSETLAAAFRVTQHGASMAMLAARIGNTGADTRSFTDLVGNKGSAATGSGSAPQAHATGHAKPVRQVQAPPA